MFPSHGVFKLDVDLSRCIPMYSHIDEGRGQSKKGVTLCNSHGAMGRGVNSSLSKQKVVKSHLKAKLNMSGHSQATRLLHYALPKKLYRGKFKGNLDIIFDHCVEGWLKLQTEGFQLNGEQWWAIVVGVKADLPALVSVGKLNRCSSQSQFMFTFVLFTITRLQHKDIGNGHRHL